MRTKYLRQLEEEHQQTFDLKRKLKEAEEYVAEHPTLFHMQKNDNTERENVWIKLFALISHFESLVWDESFKTANDPGWGNLFLSEDKKTLKNEGPCNHVNMATTKSFTKGIHR